MPITEAELEFDRRMRETFQVQSHFGGYEYANFQLGAPYDERLWIMHETITELKKKVIELEARVNKLETEK